MKKLIILITSLLYCLLINVPAGFSQEGRSLDVNVNLCMKIMFEELGIQFEKETGVKVINNFVADGPLIAQFKIEPRGDVVNVGAEFFMERIKQHVEYIKPVTIRQPVIVVPMGNPANLKNLNDFTNRGVKLCICDTKTSSMGIATKKMLDNLGIFEEVAPNVVNYPKSSIILMPYIKLRQADAGVCWRSVALQWIRKNNAEADVELIDIPLAQQVNKTSMIGVVKTSKHKELAKRYIDWVVSSDRADVYKKFGYTKFLSEEKKVAKTQ